MLRVIKRWLGITQLEDELEALLQHYGVTLEPQPRYKVKTKRQAGFTDDKRH